MLVKYKNMPTGGASDRRLKKEIQPLKDALLKVLGLQPVAWRWKNAEDGEIHYGFIAQDVEKVLPELVSNEKLKDGEAYKHVTTGDILPYLVGAIYEQQQQIDTLRNELKRRGSN